MNFLLIDDTPESIRKIQASFSGENMRNENFSLHWIDENGQTRNDIQPEEQIQFPTSLDNAFYKNIKNLIGTDTIFLIDLCLTHAENSDLTKQMLAKTEISFHAVTATRIIQELKSYNPDANIKIISRAWQDIPEATLWHGIFKDLIQEDWFNSISFFPFSGFACVNDYAGLRNELSRTESNIDDDSSI